MEKAQKSSLLRGICYILIPILVLMMLISVADEILKSEYRNDKEMPRLRIPVTTAMEKELRTALMDVYKRA